MEKLPTTFLQTTQRNFSPFLTFLAFSLLILNDPWISESCIEKSQVKFLFFTLLCDASKDFMKAFKAFTKLFETPQRSVKIKIQLIFSLRPGLGREGLIITSMPLFKLLVNQASFKSLTDQSKLSVKSRSSHPEMFLGKSVLKICSKFTGEKTHAEVWFQ